MLTIIKSSESIFDVDARLIVNPVNTVGVMGAGLAKAFKERYPEMFEMYLIHCQRSLFCMGDNLYYYADDGKVICMMPTKTHWKLPSKLEYISLGMESLVRYINYLEISSIAIPRIGCGCGGLHWEDVYKIIKDELQNIGHPTIVHILSR